MMRFAPRTALPYSALALAFVFYGAFSSPTPDALTWAEAAIGLCLIIAAQPQYLVALFSGKNFIAADKELRVLSFSFFVLFLFPAFGGLLAGHDPNDIIRDLIPLGYFFLPLFLYPLFRDDPEKIKRFLVFGLCFTGVLYALRFWPSSGLTLERFGLDRGNDEMLYLTSSPAVMFAGLYLVITATDLHPQKAWRRALRIVLGLTCLLTLAAILQRGALILSFIVLWFIVLGRILRSPRFFLLGFFTALVGMAVAGQTIIDLAVLIARKTAEVGDNARLAELQSVIGTLGDNPGHWIFGAGWGARIYTAASGYAHVRYTHMLFSYILFKAGLIGLGALFVYLLLLLERLKTAFRTDPVLIAAAFPSLLLGLTLYPSFKMLCFGAILCLVWVSAQTLAVRVPDVP